MSEFLQGFLAGYGVACILVLIRMLVWQKKIRDVRSSGNTN